MSSSPDSGLDPRAFRRALGNFATGVTIVTARAPSGEQAGVTANSFNSVSLDPPLILWSIDKRSASHAVFAAASHFAVNILAADQIELSNHFARPQEDKFAGVAVEPGLGGAPLLPDCAARFQCERHVEVDGGDHWILIGRVVAFDDFGRSPLLYHQGAYSMVLPHPRAPRRSEAAATPGTMHGRLMGNLYYLMIQAVNAYQASYAPKQLITGLSTSEARMLMVLEDSARLDLVDLQREVAMPTREIVEALTNLRRKGLVAESAAGHELTDAGRAQTEALWDISRRQQEAVFAGVGAEDLETFKRVLKVVMAAH
ncbi:p-hydroxyphenylacetate 3-hydroxylase reductase component [Pseudomonas oryzae]|uniref:NADH-FMN oxidoreductase RutF, flavin reductase (DIM6/NTAB) family n=1 Tax=Pseudomonas oryzae TaxID=1392877 RepID=A0A1H1WAT1_9PSED|nr:flavin reductase [Pseudomonas oryzae]SDS94184.1 NADH-FMN oxidoreductase RutF, flavin reductase (DIM6/NTAB) family [Pseudomonas oryzae]